MKASAFHWLRGEKSVARFDLPQAKSFSTAFCKHCGSPMPHLTQGGPEAMIHAGAFDKPLGATPDRDINWASRAGWYCHGNSCPWSIERSQREIEDATRSAVNSSARPARDWVLSWTHLPAPMMRAVQMINTSLAAYISVELCIRRSARQFKKGRGRIDEQNPGCRGYRSLLAVILDVVAFGGDAPLTRDTVPSQVVDVPPCGKVDAYLHQCHVRGREVYEENLVRAVRP